MKQIDVEAQIYEAREREEDKTSQSQKQNYKHQQATTSLPTMGTKRERLKRRLQHINQSTYLRLIEACKLKHLATIKSIINEQPELINQKDQQNRSLLHYASILVVNNNNNNTSIEDSIDLNEANCSIEVISQELANKCIECFDYITSRCELKLWWQQDYDGLNILHLAVISSNVPLVKHLVFEHPYSIKYPLICTVDNESHSPLHWAVITNNLDCVKLLVNYAGTKLVHEPDLNGATPLHYATQTRDYPKYKQQLKQMLKNVGQETSEQTPTQSNCSVQHDITSTTTTTSTCNTATTSNGEFTKKLDDTSGHIVQDQDNQSCIFNIVSDQLRGLEILEYLVKLPQINLECNDKDHRTPLLWAASSGNREAIVLLINHGSNLASFDINRLSALHCAASHGYTDCVECLLSLDSTSAIAQVNQVDNMNCTPLFYGVLSGNIDCIEILLDRGAKQDWQDTKGRTAAHFAALKGQLNSLKLLHKRGANLWLPNKQGDLPLHYAIKSGRQQVAKWLLKNSPYEHSVNAINNYGRSPIHLAIMKNNLEMVDYLIECGANLNQLVKVRDKTSSKPTTGAIPSQQLASINETNKHQSKNEYSYRYETALDMAKKLNHERCLQLLLDNRALSATQVIRNRLNSGPSVTKNGHSLFDMQSIEGPSPIGFETSYSSSGASPNMNLIETGRIPKLSRPVPDTLPQSDSTGSSALSHNSLTSIRGEPIQKQNSDKHLNHKPSIPTSSQKQQVLMNEQSVKQDYSDHDNDDGRAGRRDSDQPCKGGISYKNELFDASIKYKLFDQDALRHESRPRHFNHRSFPTQTEPRMRPQKSINGRAALSAPIDQQTQRGQEIITNVNVYTSPCPHCAHYNLDFCAECRKANSGLELGGTSRQQSNLAKQKQQARRRPFEDGFYSDETSETATTVSDETEVEKLNGLNRLPNLATGRSQVLVQPHLNPMNNDSYDLAAGTTFKRYLPPSQNHEQHLPVIISDQEQSTSAGISPESPQIETCDTLDKQREQQVPSSKNDSVESDDDGIDIQQSRGGLACTAQASQEPRFDRSRRFGDRQRFDRYREQARSPIAEYIHAPFGGGYFGGDHARPVSLNQDESTRQHYPSRADYSQVKAKVDSHRLRYDDSVRSKSTSTLHQHQQQQQSHPKSPYHMYNQQPTRSDSRQTVIRRRGSGSVDSLDLTTKVEKSIRKHRQEVKILEELQNLKRSQIRSGRANEALLVKRLADHYPQDTFNLIGLDTSYHGPFTYQSYERFLYDQLRKLSQSNCVKLAAKSPSPSHSKMDHLQQHQQHRSTNFPDTAIAIDSPTASHSDQHFLEEDMRAELELQRVVNGSVDGEPEGELNNSRFKPKTSDANQADVESIIAREIVHNIRVEDNVEKVQTEETGADKRRDENLEEERGETARDIDDRVQAVDDDSRSEMVTSRGASNSSSRRSSIDIEREKLMYLPLATREQRQAHGLEEEARSLSSSIIVDALGNVSRAGSPSRQLSMEKEADVSGSNVVSASSDSDGSPVEESRDVVEDTQFGDQEPKPKPVTSNRRRSVVNIGNKMEVIYHDVGIEIDSAADSDNTKGTEMIKRSLIQNQQEMTQSKFGDNEGLEDAAEEITGDHDDRKIEREQQEAPSGTSLTGERVDLMGEEVGGTESSVADTVVDTHSLNLQDSRKLSDSNIVRAIGKTSAASTRRVSSPPAFPYEEGAKLLDSNTGNLSRSQRASSIGTELRGDTVEVKKVFNGYDLDEMHHKRSLQVSELSRQKSQRTNSEDKTTQVTDDDDDSNISEIDDKPDYIASEARRRSSAAGKQQQVLSVEQETGEVATLEPRTTMRHRRRLPVSRLSKGKYIVNVPIEDVRDRWSCIKAAERKRKLRIARPLGDDVSKEFRFMGNTLTLACSPSLANGRHEDRLAGFSKSQQNLEDGSTSENVMFGGESIDKEDAHMNFELLYEINKSSKIAASGSKSKQSDVSRLKWCQKKAVKIIDVRTIKRTLSLPESLIYSNDLLKRFNILKL